MGKISCRTSPTVRLLKKVSHLTLPSHARRDARLTHGEAAGEKEPKEVPTALHGAVRSFNGSWRTEKHLQHFRPSKISSVRLGFFQPENDGRERARLGAPGLGGWSVRLFQQPASDSFPCPTGTCPAQLLPCSDEGLGAHRP
jgi:hypothetical protein